MGARTIPFAHTIGFICKVGGLYMRRYDKAEAEVRRTVTVNGTLQYCLLPDIRAW